MQQLRPAGAGQRRSGGVGTITEILIPARFGQAARALPSPAAAGKALFPPSPAYPSYPIILHCSPPDETVELAPVTSLSQARHASSAHVQPATWTGPSARRRAVERWWTDPRSAFANCMYVYVLCTGR